ncbi:hypothetical protein AAFC00_006796 [Neodothiora populina]|uniref:BSD domain-containing protein n=1 Tax=Neodothiora populina TaxID=2781224 RepID=A0ABR3PB72_9PEZI
MDVAYDHMQDGSIPEDDNDKATSTPRQGSQQEEPITLSTEFQQAYKAVSSSPWGAKLGGFFGHVKKQSESFYEDAQKEYASRSEQASKGLTGLLNQTRNISLAPPTAVTGAAVSFSDPTFTLPETQTKGKEKETPQAQDDVKPENPDRPESLPADIVKEATSLVSRFRSEAPSLLKRVQKAEDAADEALLKFGTNMRDWLRDAVTVTAPEGGASLDKNGETSEVLFETNDAEGKRVFHTSRFDAQLHVIHTSSSSFTQDSEGEEFDKFCATFDVDKQTEAIAADLEKYEELRRAMEKLVPDKVDYKTFWTRYYFLRKVIEEEEKRRKEVLKGAVAETEEELGWGSDDSDNEEDDNTNPSNPAADGSSSTTTLTSTTPQPASSTASTLTASSTTAAATTTTTTQKDDNNDLLKTATSANQRRKSEDADGKSTADSDASYDIVSGATSRAPGSPKEAAAAAAAASAVAEKKETAPAAAAAAAAPAVKEEESDEEDWE